MDTRMYPSGKNLRSHWVAGPALVCYDANGVELYRIDPINVTGGYLIPGVVRQLRTRVTIAQVNAGLQLLPAIPAFKYRMLSCTAIAVGGAAGSVTTVDILATQAAASVKLAAYAQASLTRSTVLKDGGSGAAVLADGASYGQCDANTPITIGKTGSSVDTATHIDVGLSYTIEA